MRSESPGRNDLGDVSSTASSLRPRMFGDVVRAWEPVVHDRRRGRLVRPLFIPSPSRGVWEVVGVPVRAYALCILVGIVVAMVIGHRRWRARGGTPDNLESVIVVAVPLGIVGARIYHVVTDYELYFGPGRHPVDALKIWNGGLGIWGAVAFGALGGWLVCRRRHLSFAAVLDSLAPGLVVAQGIGRLGNWFNSELFGRPTTLPWALEISPANRPVGYEQVATYHPTFLYELMWDLLVAVVLVRADRRWRLGHGEVFALYVVLYTAGRFWVEALRIDKVNEIGGFRLNNYTSAVVFAAALIWLIWLVLRRPGREDRVEPEPENAPPDGDGDEDERDVPVDAGSAPPQLAPHPSPAPVDQGLPDPSPDQGQHRTCVAGA